MVLDAVSNFVRGNTDAEVGTSDTTVSVDDASIFPDPATDGEFNVVIWDVNNFPRPDQDGDVEIMRVTGRDTTADDLTVTRAQEMTSAAAHPEGSAIHLSPTAKMFSDIESTFGDFWDAGTQELTADVNNTNTTTTALEADETVIGSTYKTVSNDSELSEALDNAVRGSCIILLTGVYSEDHTVNDRISLVGPVATETRGAELTGEITANDRVNFERLSFNDTDITLDSDRCRIINCYLGTGFEESRVTVNADRSIINSVYGGDVTLNSDRNFVTGAVLTTVTDNGNDNNVNTS